MLDVWYKESNILKIFSLRCFLLKFYAVKICLRFFNFMYVAYETMRICEKFWVLIFALFTDRRFVITYGKNSYLRISDMNSEFLDKKEILEMHAYSGANWLRSNSTKDVFLGVTWKNLVTGTVFYKVQLAFSTLTFLYKINW